MKENIERCKAIVGEDEQVISAFTRSAYYPLVIKGALGSTIVDADDNEYLDFLSSAAVLNVGSNHPRVVEAIIQQTKAFIHYTPGYMYHSPQIELANKLIEITPGDFKKKVAFGLSGSDAIDGVIKLARAYTGRTKIISFEQSYHGSTYGAISVSAISLNMRRKIGPLLPGMHHIPYPDCYRCSSGQNERTCHVECFQQLENALKYYIPVDEVAGFIIEPIAGDAGLIVPPQKYMDKLKALCAKHDILIISDEVQQGFGRTGKWFGIEHFDIVPDIIAMGKGISSGMPMSAIVARKDIIESMEDPAHLFTMEGNPVVCKAALATIEVIEEEELLSESMELGNYTMKCLKELKEKYAIIGDIRGKGLSIGVDLIKNVETKERHREAAAKICYECYERGMILTFFANNVLRIQPPLVITKEEIDKGISIIEESIKAYLDGEISDEVLEVVKGW